jgi:GT2 family glycosyltransferase
MRCAAVIVNWNGGKDNLACIGSLYAQGPDLGLVVLVDNASTDGSCELVAAHFPQVRIVRNAANLGFGAGSNAGAELALEAGAQSVLFVNNDATLQPGTLRTLLAALERLPTAGLVAPRVLYADGSGRVWSAGGELTWRQNLSRLVGHGEPDGPRFRVTREVDFLAGCVLLVRAATLRRVGAFDADLFAYNEDVDLALRARAAGHGSWLVGEACALHAPSSSTGGGYNARRKYMMGVNSVWLLRRWGGARQWLSFLVFDVASLPLLLALELARGRGRSALAKALGIWDGLRGRRVCARRLESGATPLW